MEWKLKRRKACFLCCMVIEWTDATRRSQHQWEDEKKVGSGGRSGPCCCQIRKKKTRTLACERQERYSLVPTQAFHTYSLRLLDTHHLGREEGATQLE